MGLFDSYSLEILLLGSSLSHSVAREKITPAGTFCLPKTTATSDPICALRFDRRAPGPPIQAARAPMDLRGRAHLPVRTLTHARDI